MYAASEGLSTSCSTGSGPGGQVGGSSRVENFIGFPAGLSGAELATRGVLQMLKFGAKMVAPVAVERLDSRPTAGDPARPAPGLRGGDPRPGSCSSRPGCAGGSSRPPAPTGSRRPGIYYACTSVEAFLHDGQDVAVVGGGNSAGQAAMFLAECCPTRQVHLLVRSKLGLGDVGVPRDAHPDRANVTVHEGTEIEASVEGTATRSRACG